MKDDGCRMGWVAGNTEWWLGRDGFTPPPKSSPFAQAEWIALDEAMLMARAMYDEEPLTDEVVEWMGDQLLKLVAGARLYGAEAYAMAVGRIPSACIVCGGEKAAGSVSTCRPCYEAVAEVKRQKQAKKAPPAS